MTAPSPTPSFVHHSAPQDYTPVSPNTGNRLGLALLVYMLAVTLMITLLPFEFSWPEQWRVLELFLPVDFVANILLFIPLGFFYALARNERRPSALHVLILGALTSAAIESAQLFEPARTSALFDVVANAVGACLGALAYGRVARSSKVDGRLVGWLALELPLMGLIYLLVPLLWINSLVSRGEVVRSLTVILLGVFGASVLGGIQRYYFVTARRSDAGRTALFAALWFLAGVFAALPFRPVEMAIGAVAVAALTWWQGRRTVRGVDYNRRFEVPVLKAAAPAYAAYLALILFIPLDAGVTEWTLHLGFPGGAAEQIEI
ncbi:MAG TPA: VanZ family protein, partial [Burkholderiales bacterium]|nr:VanZ family protein [Burkholderiales bacterium]